MLFCPSFFLTVRGAKLKEWTLVLYGTDRDPLDNPKSRHKKTPFHYYDSYHKTQTNYGYNNHRSQSNYGYNTHKGQQNYGYNQQKFQQNYYYPQRNQDSSRLNYPNSYHNYNNHQYYQLKPTTSTSTSTTTTATTTTTTTTEPPFFAKNIFSHNNNRNIHGNTHYNDAFFGNHDFPSKDHMCIFETLAKKKNMSALQYMRMVRENMTPGKQCLHILA